MGHISRLSINNRRPTDRPTDQRRTDRIPVRSIGPSARRSATVGDWYVYFLFGPSVRRSAIDGIIFSWMIRTGGPSVGDQWVNLQVKYTVGWSVGDWNVYFLFGPSVRRSAIDGIIFSWMIRTGGPSVGDQWVNLQVKYMVGRSVGQSAANLVLSSSSYYHSVGWLVADGKKKGTRKE